MKKTKKIKICGIPYKIKEVAVIDEPDEGVTQGKIIPSRSTILLKKSLPKHLKKSVLFHEILHGLLIELGYNELSENEILVQSLSNAMYQTFELKGE